MPDLLDHSRIADLQQLCRSVPSYSIQSLVAEFIKSTEAIVLQIQENKNSTDAAKMHALLHALKGGSMTIGAAQLLELAKQAEGLSKEKADANLADVIYQISKVYAETKLALQSLS